jgi:hypothetical protein
MEDMKIIFSSGPILANKGKSLENILDSSEIGLKNVKRMRMSRTKNGEYIKETDIWANSLCEKYCTLDINGKEA